MRTACVTQADKREEGREGTSYTEWPYGLKTDIIREYTGYRPTRNSILIKDLHALSL
jgi:hypothetical protein